MSALAALSAVSGAAWSEEKRLEKPNENLAAPELFIQPKLCVLPEGQALCEDEIEIRWKAQDQRHLCLFRRGTDKPLTCWEKQIAGQYRLRVSTSRDVIFQLKDMPSDQIAISEMFEVVHDQSKFRRKRRNAWSFF